MRSPARNAAECADAALRDPDFQVQCSLEHPCDLSCFAVCQPTIGFGPILFAAFREATDRSLW